LPGFKNELKTIDLPDKLALKIKPLGGYMCKYALFILSTLILSTNVNAAEKFNEQTAACVKKVSQALGLDTEEQFTRAQYTNGNCTLDIERNSYVSGYNNLPVLELRMYGNCDVNNRATLILDANEGLSQYRVLKCEVSQNVINLQYSEKQNIGWKRGPRTVSAQLQLSAGQVTSARIYDFQQRRFQKGF